MAGARTSISPTAHYTGAVWGRRGLSHPALATPAGRVMYWSMWPAMAATRALGGARLEDFLYARHVLIDRLLERAVERGEVSQVVEVAAGMSPRGWRFAERHGERLTYVESDLPAIVERKRAALGRAGSLGSAHRVEVVDALREGGPGSLEDLAERLDPERGVAVISEGLLSYLERDSVLALWHRLAALLSRFAHGLMLADLHLAGDNSGPMTAIGVRALSAFVRGPVAMHFENEAEAIAALRQCGFAEASLHSGTEASDTPGAGRVRVVEAKSSRSSPGGAASERSPGSSPAT